MGWIEHRCMDLERGSTSRRRGAIAGGLAGLVGGLATGALLADQDAMAGGGFGATGANTGFALYLIASVALGAGFGLVVSYARGAYAADIAGGVVLGLPGVDASCGCRWTGSWISCFRETSW